MKLLFDDRGAEIKQKKFAHVFLTLDGSALECNLRHRSNKDFMMSRPSQFPSAEEQRLLGDIRALTSAIGLPQLHFFSEGSRGASTTEVSEHIEQFLRRYAFEMLVPFEFPVIRDAYLHTERNEASELVNLDWRLRNDLRLGAVAVASQAAGQKQLRRLRALRDQRVIRKYSKAVDANLAFGWHTIVYGMTLAVYSFPLVEGMRHYAEQTIGGLALEALKEHPALSLSHSDLATTMVAQLSVQIASVTRCEQVLRMIP